MKHQEWNVRNGGAKGDGVTLDQAALQAVVDRCAAAGGGTVRVPAGAYLIGTVELRSNVCVHLDMGARLLAADRPECFPEISKTPHGNLPGQIQAVLWADNAENITVSGSGTVDGGHPEALSSAAAVNVRFRPALVFFRNCRNVKFLDVTLQHSSLWTLHLQRCVDVMVRGVTIRNNPHRINADGIDPDGCRNVIISDCNIIAGDDAICIKSTEGDPCENIVVSNCVLSTTCAALKIGTEALGDIRNITFTNCVIHDTNVALALYMKDGSTYENMIFSNMIIESRNQFPILVDVTPRYYREPRQGRIRSIVFENVMVSSPGRCQIEGLPDMPIENLTLRNITWNVTGPLQTGNVRKPAGARRTERDPDAPNHAANPYQFVAAHVRDLEVSNVKLYDRRTDADTDASRGLIHLHDVRGATLERLSSKLPVPAGLPPIGTVDCADVTGG